MTLENLGPIREELYLGRGIRSKEELETILKETVAPDATRLKWIADCPRRAQYALHEGIGEIGDVAVLKAGGAVHAGLAVYYATGDGDLSLETARKKWGLDAAWRAPGKNFAHLHLGLIEVVLKNYFVWAKKHDTFKPITMRLDEMNLENVLGAIFRTTEDGRVILGESKLVMEFIIGGEAFVYSGIPDLPIEMGGAYYMLDHKSTNSYLSEWWAGQFRFSNQFRGYIGMLTNLTRINFSGAMVNAIYIGEKSVVTESKAQKFGRFGPYMYQQAHIQEAILNQFFWRKNFNWWKEQGYFPQHDSKLCSGCPFDKLCDTHPAARQSVIDREFQKYDVQFLNI